MEELLNGELVKINIDNKSKASLSKIDHLIIKSLDDKICVINSYTNRCLLFDPEDWKGVDEYPTNVVEALVCELVPETLQEKNEYTTFVIALSYACNLKCTYCYQQNNDMLIKDKITEENLEYILNTIRRYKNNNENEKISIELFGGEPLLPENKEYIIKIFEFCVENGISVGITTNGSYLSYFIKDLVIYRSLNMSIYTTVDSIYNNEATRCAENKDSETTYMSPILKNVKLLIENGVIVTVTANIDKHNIHQIDQMISFYEREGFLSNERFLFILGRVDDRFYETHYSDIVSEVDILEKLGELEKLPDRVYASFIRAPYDLCNKIGLNYRQKEPKGRGNYCWAVGSCVKVYYVDADLDTFRCTYTVGRKELSMFKFSYDTLKSYKAPNRTVEDIKKCHMCKIGGYCGGGCEQSAKINFNKQCDSEKEHFEEFLNKIFYPTIYKLGSGLTPKKLSMKG